MTICVLWLVFVSVIHIWLIAQVVYLKLQPYGRQKYAPWSKKPAPQYIRLRSSITIHVNITIFCYNVRTINVIQQVTVCARKVHQELWHKHEDEYATVPLMHWSSSSHVVTIRSHSSLMSFVWCCKHSASSTRFCSLPDSGPNCLVAKVLVVWSPEPPSLTCQLCHMHGAQERYLDVNITK